MMCDVLIKVVYLMSAISLQVMAIAFFILFKKSLGQ